MKAVVLLGGLGTRLRPLTFSTPKQMLPVAGVPMIERVLDHIGGHGVRDAVLSLGYRPDAFKDAYPGGVCSGVRLEYAVEPEPLDTAGAVRFAARRAGIDEPFLVVNGDVLTKLDLGRLIDFHQKTGAEGTIALTPVEDPSHFGVVPTDERGLVLAFIEKPPRGEAPTNLINAGFYVLAPSVIDRVAEGRRVNIERETFPAMVEDRTLYALADDSFWIDVGTPARYIDANVAFQGNGSVTDGALVDPTATVESSVVLPGAVVEGGASIRRSIVGRGARIGAGACLDEFTVVGDEAVVPAGTVLVGVRFPEGDE